MNTFLVAFLVSVGHVHARDAALQPSRVRIVTGYSRPGLPRAVKKETSLRVAQQLRAVSVARTMIIRYRYAGFLSELAESLRPLIAHWKVQMAYGVSWMYCLIDAIVRGAEARLSGCGLRHTARSMLTAVIFHTLATMAIPAILINTVVHYSAEV